MEELFVLTKELNANSAIVYLLVVDNEGIQISMSALGNIVGLSRQTVSKCIDALVEAGYIEKTRNYTEAGGLDKSSYKILK